ncbi:MAG TPA: F0F1 ATP synthase subunit A [Dehalococcoidia bacterium]|nr:F0F1 ATP synthase subunit A [Dehalococcoidia bacterium]
MKPKLLIYVAAILAAIGVGVFVFKGVAPAVILPSEPIFQIGPWAVRNTILTSWLVIVFLVVTSLLATRGMALVPVRSLQNFVEALLEWMYGIVEDAAGPANARRFFPLIGTIFLYVVCSNWFGLLPFYGTFGRVSTPEVAPGQTGRAVALQTYHLGPLPIAVEPLNPKPIELKSSPSGDVERTDGQPLARSDGTPTAGTIVPFFRSVFSDANAPLSIAIISFIAVEYWGLSTLGVGTYLGKFFNLKALARGPMGAIDVVVGLLELISEFVRVISFTFRLLGNIFAGEVLIIYMTFLVPFIIPTLFYGLELFVGFIQASVFALLTLVFAVMAVEHHESHEQHHAGQEQIELEPA